jgi:hypothetical protein
MYVVSRNPPCRPAAAFGGIDTLMEQASGVSPRPALGNSELP